MGVRVKVGFEDSVGVQIGKFSLGYLWCSWSIGRLRRPWTLEGDTFGNELLAEGPWGGGGVVGVLGPVESPPPPPPVQTTSCACRPHCVGAEIAARHGRRLGEVGTRPWF